MPPLPKPAALAGTRAAYETCTSAGCGHNAIKHALHGTGACLAFNWQTKVDRLGAPHLNYVHCPCTIFTPKG